MEECKTSGFDVYNVVLDVLIIVIVAMFYVKGNTDDDSIKYLIYLCVLLSIIFAILIYFLKYFQELVNSAYGKNLEMFCIKENIEYETGTFWYSKSDSHDLNQIFYLVMFSISLLYLAYIIYKNNNAINNRTIIMITSAIVITMGIVFHKKNIDNKFNIITFIFILCGYDLYKVLPKILEQITQFESFSDVGGKIFKVENVFNLLFVTATLFFLLFMLKIFDKRNYSWNDIIRDADFWVFFGTFIASIAIFAFLMLFAENKDRSKQIVNHYMFIIITISFLLTIIKALDITDKEIKIDKKFIDIQESSGIYCLIFIIMLFISYVIGNFIDSDFDATIKIMSILLALIYLFKTLFINNIFEIMKITIRDVYAIFIFIAIAVMLSSINPHNNLYTIILVIAVCTCLAIYYYYSYRTKQTNDVKREYKKKLIEINIILSDIIGEIELSDKRTIILDPAQKIDDILKKDQIGIIYKQLIDDDDAFSKSFQKLYIQDNNAHVINQFLTDVKNRYRTFMINEIAITDRVPVNNDKIPLYLADNKTTEAAKRIEDVILNSMKEDLLHPDRFGYTNTLNIFQKDIIDRYNSIKTNEKYTRSTDKILPNMVIKYLDKTYNMNIITNNKDIIVDVDASSNTAKICNDNIFDKLNGINKEEKFIDYVDHLADAIANQEQIGKINIENLVSTYISFFDQNYDDFKAYMYSYFGKTTYKQEILYNKVVEFHDIKKRVQEKYDWYEKLVFAFVCILMIYICLTFVEYISLGYLKGYSINLILLIFIVLIIVILNIIIMINKLK